MASESAMPAFLIVLLLLCSSSCVSGGVVKVCNGNLSYKSCANCCALTKGCMYLQPGTGYPTCIGGETRACPRNCEPSPKLLVCPSSENLGFGKSDVQIVKGKLPPSGEGCTYYNIWNGDEILEDDEALLGVEKKKCKVDSLVQVCNGEVSKENCGCCGAKKGCLFFPKGSANNTCLPIESGVCLEICIPTVSVCSKSINFQGTTLEYCTNARQSCADMKDGCSLYDRTTGEDKCLASIKMYNET